MPPTGSARQFKPKSISGLHQTHHDLARRLRIVAMAEFCGDLEAGSAP